MKNWIGLIILILVGIAAYFLVIKDGDINLSSSEEDFKDFAVEDTASVDKIFLSHSKSEQEGRTYVKKVKDFINLSLQTQNGLLKWAWLCWSGVKEKFPA